MKREEAIERVARVLAASGQPRTKPPLQVRWNMAASSWDIRWDDYTALVFSETGYVRSIDRTSRSASKDQFSRNNQRFKSDSEVRDYLWRIARALNVPRDARLQSVGYDKESIVNAYFEQPAPGGHAYLDQRPCLTLQIDGRDGSLQNVSQNWGQFIVLPITRRISRDTAVQTATRLFHTFLQNAAPADRKQWGLPSPNAPLTPTMVRFGYSSRTDGYMIRSGQLETTMPNVKYAGESRPTQAHFGAPWTKFLRPAWVVSFGQSRVILDGSDGQPRGFYPPTIEST